MDIMKIIVFVLQIINKWMDSTQAQKYIKQGRDEGIAEQLREIFRKTSYAHKTMEDTNAMSNEEVDAALVGLEPSDPPVSVPTDRPKPL